MEISTIFLGLAATFGFIMAWGVGANDVANAMGTSVGSRALTIRQAIVIATIFEFLGAFLAGGEVTDTIRKGIIDTASLSSEPNLFILGMMASLLAAGIWLAVATRFGWPVSTSHTIVGAIVGFGVISLGFDAIYWPTIGKIAFSWLLSPLLGMIIAFGIFFSVQILILNHNDPFQRAKKVIPFYIFIVAWIITVMIAVSGLDHLGVNISDGLGTLYATLLSIIIALIGKWRLNKIKIDPEASKNFHFANVEKLFGLLMLFTACAMAFAHGSNDVANAIGPLAAIADVITTGEINQQSPIPIWVLLLGSVGIVCGLITYGHKVIATVGSGITELTPSRGFAATLSAAATVVLASGTGLPISTTHTLVGAVLGVGLARGINALNTNVIRMIFLSWVVTLPAGAILAVVFYKLLLFIFRNSLL